MSYNVYVAEYLSMPRNHVGIFVETDEGGPRAGRLFEVQGSIQDGMYFEEKPAEDPTESHVYAGKKQLIGRVVAEDLGRFSTVCQGIPTPEKQFKGAKPINPGKPLRRCQEWT